MLADALRAAMLGPVRIARLCRAGPALQRHVFNTPRKRITQQHVLLVLPDRCPIKLS
jgi:hypothetical protein